MSGYVLDKDLREFKRWKKDWCAFARELLHVKLDKQQEEILRSVQLNSKTTVRSGHARGKDYGAAVANVCFLTLEAPCKAVCSAQGDICRAPAGALQISLVPELCRYRLDRVSFAPTNGNFN